MNNKILFFIPLGARFWEEVIYEFTQSFHC